MRFDVQNFGNVLEQCIKRKEVNHAWNRFEGKPQSLDKTPVADTFACRVVAVSEAPPVRCNSVSLHHIGVALVHCAFDLMAVWSRRCTRGRSLSASMSTNSKNFISSAGVVVNIQL